MHGRNTPVGLITIAVLRLALLVDYCLVGIVVDVLFDGRYLFGKGGSMRVADVDGREA